MRALCLEFYGLYIAIGGFVRRLVSERQKKKMGTARFNSNSAGHEGKDVAYCQSLSKEVAERPGRCNQWSI